jgi:tetratricopeptide (TPR) repeat protein
MPEDPLLLEAQSAIGTHDKKKAREILRRLIKADPRNIEYWLWLSVSVDTPREIVYCLQEVLKIDPDNKIAKKGLIFHGVIKPDPASGDDLLTTRRDWQKEYIRKHTPAPPSDNKTAPVKKPVSPLIWIGLALIMVVAASLITGFPWSLFRHNAPAYVLNRPTPKPSATYLPTKTPFGYVELPTATSEGPAPLWTLLKATYTPTPLYIQTPHSTEAYLLAMRAYERGDLETFRRYMDQAIAADPNNPDFYFYLAEADKQHNRNKPALTNYEKALSIDPEFAPAYLGRARMTLMLSPTKNYINDINQAIKYDPKYSEAYLERARYYIRTHQLDDAVKDLEMVLRINPQTPVAYALLSEIYLSKGEPQKALEAAQTANKMDITLLQSYLAIGSAYIAIGKPQESIEYLTTYKNYAPLDARAYESLGVAYWSSGDVQQTLEMMSKSIDLDPFSFTPYLIRGLANVQMNNMNAAADDFTKAIDINDNSFIAVYNRAKVWLGLNRNTDAYNQFLRSEDLLDDESLRAEVIYYQAKSAMAIGDRSLILDAWKRLLALPEGTVNQAWLDEARTYLNPCKGSKCPTFTPSPTVQPTVCKSTYCPTVFPSATISVTTSLPIPTVTPTP